MSQNTIKPVWNFKTPKPGYAVDSSFEIPECLGRILPDPILINAQDYSPVSYTADYQNGIFSFYLCGKSIQASFSEERLKRIQHEIIFNCYQSETDERLSTIGVSGPESILTPDYIDKTKKYSMDLAGIADTSEHSLENEYKGKIKKYRYLLEPLGYQFDALIVSSTRVYTGFEIKQSAVDALCYRHRIGMALKAFITRKLGKDIFYEDLSWAEFRVKKILESIPNMAVSSGIYDVNMILKAGEGVTKTDMSEVKTIMMTELANSTRKSEEKESLLSEYFDSFTPENSKISNKRISNIPQIILTGGRNTTDRLVPSNSNMPDWLKTIWTAAMEVKYEEESLETLIKESIGEKEYTQHRVAKSTGFRVNLSTSDRISAAHTGLFGKEFKGFDEMINKREEDSKSFHPLHNQTDDIEDFINTKWLSRKGSKGIDEPIQKLLQSAKSVWNQDSTSMELFRALAETQAVSLGSTITELMQEVAFCYKYWLKSSHFHHKVSKSGVHILIRATGSHIFTSFAFPKAISKHIELGRIGPTIFETDNFWITDISSFNEPDLEHFVKAGPYILSIAAHLMSQLELELDIKSLDDTALNQDLAGIMLLYFNNKTDSEELVTAQRYLTMGVLEELDPNPFRFVSRLPEVLRSRLTCYLTVTSMRLMYHYSAVRPIKAPGPEPSIAGLLSLFGQREVSLGYKINEFYFGYVVSKERGRGSDRNFKIMKKIVTEEYKARDTVTNTILHGTIKQMYCSNLVVLKVFCSLFKHHLEGLYGSEWKSVIEKEIITRLARTSFSDLSTMKVASRSYQSQIILPNLSGDESTPEILSKLRSMNPAEFESRPRVLEALSGLVKEYVDYTNHIPEHVVELLPYCLGVLIRKGFFDSDLFPKPQHGGDREIHVLEIMARICQYHFETAARAISSLSPSDSLTHPGQKEGFSKAHHKLSEQRFSSYHTLGKSADATKWCQRNHSSKFAAMMITVCPSFMIGFVLSIMWLWTRKRISFPIQFVANFIKNKSTPSNKIYKRLQTDFLNGTGLFTEVQNNKMWIFFGMFQGILHYMSTLCHLIICVSMSIFQLAFLSKCGLKVEITHVQGSDDSAQLISSEGKATPRSIRLITTAMMWKEKVSEYLSVYCNRAKSSIGCLDLVEFNSEWSYKQHIFKPTFRWVSASMTSPITERFIDRYRQNQNTLTSLLEGGGKILEVAVIQLSQAWLHYLLLGVNLRLGELASIMLDECQDPALGFYPLDSDFTAGITGSEFNVYCLYRLGRYNPKKTMQETEVYQTDDEIIDPDIPHSLRSVRIPFGNIRIWYGTLRRMQIPGLDEIIAQTELDPSLVFENHKDWRKGQYSVFLKMFQPGVKESISAYSPIIRQMAAAAYLLSRPCMLKIGSQDKCSLLKLLLDKTKEPPVEKCKPEQLLPYWREYEDMLTHVKTLESKHSLINQPLAARSKLKVTVFEKFSTEFPILDMCKRQWKFRVKLALSNRQFTLWWEDLKKTYPFLHDSMALTKFELKMNNIELNNYLSSLDSKSRTITLLDTTAKGASIKHAMTRIFWPLCKVAQPQDPGLDLSLLRQALYGLSCCWYPTEDKERLAKEFLIKCKSLDSWPDSPNAKILKAMRDWALGVDKFKIMASISRYHLGNYGVFTVVQEGYGKNRKGPGEWLGTIAGVNIKIHMHGTICTKIELSSLEETMTLGPSLLEMLTLFFLEPPERDPLCKLWLDGKGKFSQGKGAMENQFQCYIDKDLQQIEVDNFASASWFLNLDHGVIRLKAALDTGEKITIVSEKFRKSDWAGYDVHTGLTSLDCWISGKVIPLYALEDNLSGLAKNIDVNMKKPRLLSREGWNVWTLVENISAAYDLDVENIPEEEDKELIYPDELDEWITELTTTLEGAQVEDWAEDTEEDMFQYEVEDSEALDNFLDMFEYVSIGLEKTLKTLPVARACFSGLSSLCYILTGTDFRSFILSDTSHTGLLGLVKAFIRKNSSFYNHEATWELIEISVAGRTADLTDDLEAGNLDSSELSKMITYLKENPPKPGAPKMITDKYSRTLQATERLFYLHTRRTEVDSMENTSTNDFFSQLISKHWSALKLPNQFGSISPNVLLTVLKDIVETKLSQSVRDGIISGHDQSLMFESLRSPHLTSFLVDAVSLAFGIRITVSGYSAGFGEVAIAL